MRKGGALVADSLTVEDVVRPETVLSRLGARRVELGLQYGGKRTVTPSRVTAGWTDHSTGEVEGIREIAFGSSSASPRECNVVIDVTRRFLKDAQAAESLLQNVMQEACESEAERVQVAGTGNGAEPLGILPIALAGGIASTAGSVTYARLLECLQGRVDAGARLRRCGWLFSAADFEDSMALEMTGGFPAISGNAADGWSLAGRPVEWSDFLPTGHVICGEFNTCEIVYQGAPQLLVNPYSRAQQQITQISLYDTFDTSISRPNLLGVIIP
jgi:HK97 family phage major capsid protein